MANGKLTRLYPGGNTPQGFYSFYDNIIAKDAARIFILKGGPGTGKSTLMRKIGETMLEKGYDVEFHCCSSDNDSLDGVCIPALQVAILDGTAPHMVDPQTPGAVDEIVCLGDFWAREKLQSVKQEIMHSSARNSRLFKIAFHQLAEAKVIKDELDSYLEEAANIPRMRETAWKITKSVFKDAPAQYEREPKNRRLFATAYTPQGYCHQLDSILQGVKKLYLVTGTASKLASHVIGIVAQAAQSRGLDTNTFHCPLAPEDIDMIIIPQQRYAVMKDIPDLKFKAQSIPSITKVKLYNLDQYLNDAILKLYTPEIDSAQKRLAEAIDRAINYIAKAKAEHDRLENYYLPAMNFNDMNAKRDQILADILKYTTT